MKQPPERDPVLLLIDAMLADLAVRTDMYVGRRRGKAHAKTFVIQTGEEGRHRLRRPDLNSDASIARVVAGAQRRLAQVLGAPVPLCPLHLHALRGDVHAGQLTWVCPKGEWECALGEYEETTWPQLDVSSLAPILSRRLWRRGPFPAVRTIGVSHHGGERVADFGLVEMTPELLRTLTEIAAPLRVITHETLVPAIRVGSPADSG